MSLLHERLNSPISTAELQRRWAAVRASMSEAKVDALLLQNSNDFLGGYVKWFTDLPATTGYPTTIIFPRDGAMTVVSQGTFGLDRKISPAGEQQYRGVERLIGAPGYASARYTTHYEAEAVEKALTPFAHSTIGLVGASHTAILLDHLRKALPRASFDDATDLVDAIKAVKSDEEVTFIQRTASMQDKCMEAVAEAIRPGMRDIDVGAVAERVGRHYGSEQGIFLCASGPAGTAAVYGIRHFQNRIIQKGDVFNILIENNGPGGMYTELGRTFVIGRASTEMKDDFAVVREAQHLTAEMLAKGNSPRDIWEAYNSFMRKHSRPEESRLYCHGQGYDLVERPLVRFDESLPIGPTMNFACHPTTVTATNFASCCDNFLISPKDISRLHNYPQEIIEIT
ncbi:MAG: aminopeptidase P family protein [Rhodospirillaceae bacterium]|nr:aminopeptidase P family protein [Rhodospirillaceae bacterium]